jgi:hypothetical protein
MRESDGPQTSAQFLRTGMNHNKRKMDETMTSHDWLNHALVMIMTMREDDAASWNTHEARGLRQVAVSGRLASPMGGVTAFYPTDIPNHRAALRSATGTSFRR